MFKHKRFVKIVGTLLTVVFIFSTLTMNVDAADDNYGTANVATGTGDVGNHGTSLGSWSSSLCFGYREAAAWF